MDNEKILIDIKDGLNTLRNNGGVISDTIEDLFEMGRLDVSLMLLKLFSSKFEDIKTKEMLDVFNSSVGTDYQYYFDYPLPDHLNQVVRLVNVGHPEYGVLKTSGPSSIGFEPYDDRVTFIYFKDFEDAKAAFNEEGLEVEKDDLKDIGEDPKHYEFFNLTTPADVPVYIGIDDLFKVIQLLGTDIFEV